MNVEHSRGAGAQSVIVESTGCGFNPHSRIWNIYLHLYFSFLRSGAEAKRGVELRQLTRNASTIWRNVGKGVF